MNSNEEITTTTYQRGKNAAREQAAQWQKG